MQQLPCCLFCDFEQSLHGLCLGHGGTVFKAHELIVAGLADHLEDLLVVDLAGARLVASGIVRNVEVTNEVDVLLNLR